MNFVVWRSSLEAATRAGGMDRQVLCDCVHRFNKTGRDALLEALIKSPTPRLSLEQMSELAALFDAGPDRQSDGMVLWRRVDLKLVMTKRIGVDFHDRHVGTRLKKLGFLHVSARPHPLGQDVEIIGASQ